MLDSYIYIIFVPISIIILLGIILFFKTVSSSSGIYKPKNIKKKIVELEKKIEINPKDYNSIYELAVIEEQYNMLEKALERYEKLLNVKYFEGEELSIYKKLEEIYNKLDNKEEKLKYTLKIAQIDVNNTYYSIKAATELGREGAYKLATEYFNRVLNNKSDFEIYELKIAAISYFMNKEYRKVISMLEELHKRLNRNISNIEEDYDEMILVEKILISLYIITDEINSARDFTETILSSRTIRNYPEFHFFINRIYLYILYKSDDNEAFINLFNQYSKQYKINEIKKEESIIILDFGFYNYFIKDINSAMSYFEHIRLFNDPEFNIYDLDNIFNYLSEIAKAEVQLKKLREDMQLNNNDKYVKENYEKYVNAQCIESWETSVRLWEESFNSLDSILNLIEIERNVDIEKILLECNINENNATIDTVSSKKVDKIYDISLASFKSICQDIIQKKLLYSAVQEYNEKLIDYDYGDEVNYLAFAVNKSKKDLTLISFKRWRNTEVGELVIRDFMLLINEAGAKNGILVLPLELTNSARSYATHNNKIKVYTRNQFNYMLRDSRI
ncbi:restriction endonuclease [Brachyspira hyodysenteriae]|uniref:restriction endonuclease n=1 Tax=Brachyspira hyodysenteriae TaxID=159 RepID=UPI0022CD77B9|nr:restriction endonuclease [Brachyspira hyodysenteriae]MCZ9870896.1 restriction endonuclease [Brachyspira hyodysenteriae]MCZ9879939.1 restriction endonuclease [Brachyspira hyodysenteriae]MCZ9898163.1 restriction endonuclease [Brachyspira hyodysenteriae]MCZ9952878.1 restriction endonuclease [Brachyspira hyodysenteriae]MCZ9973436.1 restriction endonuclease [Brachyspira hyodysenteriae]